MLECLGGLDIITRSFQEVGRRSERREDALLLVLKMEEVDMSQGMRAAGDMQGSRFSPDL